MRRKRTYISSDEYYPYYRVKKLDCTFYRDRSILVYQDTLKKLHALETERNRAQKEFEDAIYAVLQEERFNRTIKKQLKDL